MSDTDSSIQKRPGPSIAWNGVGQSREEALAWTRRFPNPSIDGGEGEIEVRPFFELEDFGDSPSVERARQIGLQA